MCLLCIGEGEALESSGDTAVSEAGESWDLIFCGGGGGLCMFRRSGLYCRKTSSLGAKPL